MAITVREATLADLDLLIQCRVDTLRETNGLDDTADLSHIAEVARAYYLRALPAGEQVTCLAFDDDLFIGCGAVCFYTVLPTCHTPSGQKAYIMNMYTHPAYRRQGVGSRILDMLVSAAKARGIRTITLEATTAGRPLYETHGFVAMPYEMELLQDELPDRSL